MPSNRWTEADLAKLRPGMVQPEHSPQPQHVEATGTEREPKMNKTEAAFAQLLEMRYKAGELLWWEFEPMNLRLGVNCFYRIDFMVMEASGRLVAYEVKGHWEDDALVKIRTAAEKFPWPFIAVQLVKGEWKYRHF